MELRYLDKAKNRIELSGEIEGGFEVRSGARITFAKGATFQGRPINEEAELYNGSYLTREISSYFPKTLAEEISIYVEDVNGDTQRVYIEQNFDDEEKPFEDKHIFDCTVCCGENATCTIL